MVHTRLTWPLLASTLALVGILTLAGPVSSAAANDDAMIASAPSQQASPLTDNLRLPAGFQVNLFATGIGGARFMVFGPAGELYVVSRAQSAVIRLRDTNHDGVADESVVLVDGLNRPHGITYHQGWIYIGETNRVIRVLDSNGDGLIEHRETVVPDLPSGGGHFTRTVELGPDGKLYVAVGSSCNVCIEPDARRAALLQFDSDGSNGRVFASGLRNSVGFVFHPETGEIWATDNGRDMLGDDYPPEEINVVRDGAHYGWPFCHGNREPDPEFGDPAFCTGTVPPTVSMQAHSAPLGLTFYTGSSFPSDYQGDIFVAFHGSWNRSVPTGYKVVRVHMQDGVPGAVEDFLDGFHNGAQATGRPVQPVVGPDGALYISDDASGAVYRVAYTGR